MNTRTADIPHDRWSEYFEALSREHRGHIASITMSGSTGGRSRPEPRVDRDVSHVRDVPFEAMSVVLEGSREVISLVVRERTRHHAMYTVHAPIKVMSEPAAGMAKSLQVQRVTIESEGGGITTVFFHPASIPDTKQAQTMTDPGESGGGSHT